MTILAHLLDPFKRRRGRKLVAAMQQCGLTYLSTNKFESILSECRAARLRCSNGLFIEAGCALGGSTVVIADQRPAQANFIVFDTFEGMPPPTERDSPDVHDRYNIIKSGESTGINGEIYYGYRNDLEEHVKTMLATHLRPQANKNISLIRGLVQDTLNINSPVAFAHIDVDWYDPVLTCAQRIFPYLEIGGCIIFDDYSDYESCRNAVNFYFDDKREQVEFDTTAGSCCVRRLSL